MSLAEHRDLSYLCKVRSRFIATLEGNKRHYWNKVPYRIFVPVMLQMLCVHDTSRVPMLVREFSCSGR